MLVQIKEVDYAGGLEDLEVSGHLVENINHLLIERVQDIMTNPYLVMQILLKVEEV